MSDQENETSTDETTSTKDRPLRSKPSPFLSSLRDNQVAQAKEALMKTVCENPGNSMGSIFEALENDADGEYIMLEIFKSLTVEELVQAAAPSVLPGWGSEGFEVNAVPLPDDGDDGDFEDDDEFEDDGTLEDDDDAPVPAKSNSKKKPTPKKSNSKKKVKASASKKAPPKTTPKTTPKTSGSDDVAHQKAILKCLSENKAKDAESAMTGPAIREIVGGDDVEFRAAMGAIRGKGRAGVTGKARGTKYFRIPKKRV